MRIMMINDLTSHKYKLIPIFDDSFDSLDNNEKARKRNVKHENYSISKLVSTLYY